MDDGTKRPTSYGSRTLSPGEKNTRNRLDKEAAVIMFGGRKFHTYFYGRQFNIYTDHKPLLGLLQSRKQIPTTASPRKLRWAVFLSSYQLMYIEVVIVMVTRIVLTDSHCQLKSRMSLSWVGGIIFVMDHLGY